MNDLETPLRPRPPATRPVRRFVRSLYGSGLRFTLAELDGTIEVTLDPPAVDAWDPRALDATRLAERAGVEARVAIGHDPRGVFAAHVTLAEAARVLSPGASLAASYAMLRGASPSVEWSRAPGTVRASAHLVVRGASPDSAGVLMRAGFVANHGEWRVLLSSARTG